MYFDPVPDYFFKQSGVIPYRIKSGKLEVMLVSSRKSGRWVIPKGVVEPYMTPEESAVQEAYEEAGVFGKITGEAVGEYSVEKWGGTCVVKVFPMVVEKEYEVWMESDFRKRKWMKAETAAEKAGKKAVRELIKKFIKSSDVYRSALYS